MNQLDAQEVGGGTLVASESTSGTDFLTGDVMTRLWSDESDVATMAAKKKKKKTKKKPSRKVRPTKNRPGCDTTGHSCTGS